MQKISTCLWFNSEAEEAAAFYTALFADSSIGQTMPGPDGKAITVEFEIEGREFTALNGGPAFNFTEAVSLVVNCATQEEVDKYWDALVAGGEQSQCGWLKDKYGLSWQIVPTALPGLLTGPDAAGAQRAMEAMLRMQKLDINVLQKAYDGD
ncbi:VOC family protein [Arthrobacter cavernae]|uniref:VOC family protein n=1 Tax=Arthrobacter cavernae TaxID=2817681 RepID=A0A939KMK0_9MICC|nr:VOC family protein [Arthrobacter cavernae]MBO1268378.1 VOC family protein [Arthrobacter cavernae]